MTRNSGCHRAGPGRSARQAATRRAHVAGLRAEVLSGRSDTGGHRSRNGGLESLTGDGSSYHPGMTGGPEPKSSARGRGGSRNSDRHPPVEVSSADHVAARADRRRTAAGARGEPRRLRVRRPLRPRPDGEHRPCRGRPVRRHAYGGQALVDSRGHRRLLQPGASVPVTDIAGPPVYSRGGLAYDDCRPRRCMSSRARATGGGTGTERLTPGSGGRPALVDDTRVTRSAAARHPRSARTRSPSRARPRCRRRPHGARPRPPASCRPTPVPIAATPTSPG